MIERALQGNLCRCTGYRPIIQGFKLFTSDHAEKRVTDCPMGEKCCKNQKTQCGSEGGSVRESTSSTFIPDHETQEPIFPPELKTVKIEELTIRRPRATWYRPTTLDRLMAIRRTNP